jgi:hypothetical protein
LFLELVQDTVKSKFGDACFANWNGKWVPVLVLSPYDCADEYIRREWHKMYREYLDSKKGSKMNHLVLWYGFEDVSEKYGFVTEFKSFEDGENEGLFHSNATTGSQLTTNEQRERDGLKKLRKAFNLPAKDRLVRNNSNLYSQEKKRPFSNYEAILHDTGTQKESTLVTVEEKKDRSFVYTDAMEETEFSKNVTELLPIMLQMKAAVSAGKRELMFSLLHEISILVHGIAPSFLLRHEIPKIFKEARKAFNDEGAKAKLKCITDSMNSVYHNKIDRRPKAVKAFVVSLKPEGIPVVKPNQQTLIPNSVVLPKNDKQQQTITKSLDTRNTISRVGLTKRMLPCVSLKKLIHISQQSDVTPLVVDKKNNQQTSQTISVTPKWLTEDLQYNLEQQVQDDDDNRKLGKELLCCLDVDWPDELYKKINFESFVFQLEQAIFKWSQNSHMDIPLKCRKGHPGEYSYPYPDNYFKKVGHIISGLSIGNASDRNHTPRLLNELLQGKFPSPMDLVKLSRSEIYNSLKS